VPLKSCSSEQSQRKNPRSQGNASKEGFNWKGRKITTKKEKLVSSGAANEWIMIRRNIVMWREKEEELILDYRRGNTGKN